MKFVLLFLISAVVLIWLTTRFRRQINELIVAFRSNDLSSTKSKINVGKPERSFEMIKCAACGTWTPFENAALLNSGEKFCSQECVDEAIAIKKATNRY